ncbi:hypothetical protein RHS04_04806 [Rhizoctonia solani]|uniref:Uncharacterized protein n=1 Tax=Rhizoctonia solani TaxID=456999 RepID=A0A8H7H7F4_9AGAM|nr:hypothetical protein RHS04_04806 [Rhizoctonia solani]
MPPKRKADTEDGPAKKKAATAPKLKKSKAPNWNEDSGYSNEKPTTEWARKCVDRWCLLPPYNTRMTEKHWQDYYNERSALDKINSSGAPESKEIVSEELCQDTWKILRGAARDLASIVLGSKLDDEDRKKHIARTLMGSLYFTELWGNDEGDDTPREVQAKSRLYSPFGVGTSIDFYYFYHLRPRMFGKGERFASFYAKSRPIVEIDPENPTACSATKRNANGAIKAASDAITVFDRNGSKSKGTTAANVKSFEQAIFGVEGWISPLKLVEILFAAGTVMRYREQDKESPKSVLAKFQYFDGETNGRALLAEELKLLAELEAREPASPEVCIPQRMLLLARQGDGGSEPGPSNQRTSVQSDLGVRSSLAGPASISLKVVAVWNYLSSPTNMPPASNKRPKKLSTCDGPNNDFASRSPTLTPETLGRKGFLAFPDELVYLIFSYYTEIKIEDILVNSTSLPNHFLDRFKALRNLSQLCQLSRKMYLPLLWERVQICVATGGAWYREHGKNMERKSEGLLKSPHLWPYVRTLTVCFTRFEPRKVIPPFVRLLKALPNLQTLEIPHAHGSMTSILKSYFEGNVFPTIQKVVMPTCAHEILRCCPGIREVTCNEGDGGTLVSALVSAGCSSLEVLEGIAAGPLQMKRLVNQRPPLRRVQINVRMKDPEKNIKSFSKFPSLRVIELDSGQEDVGPLVKIATDTLRSCAMPPAGGSKKTRKGDLVVNKDDEVAFNSGLTIDQRLVRVVRFDRLGWQWLSQREKWTPAQFIPIKFEEYPVS